MSTMPKKTCRGCGLDKPTSEYYRYSGSRDGLNNHCRTCVNARNKKWYDRNRAAKCARTTEVRRARQLGMTPREYREQGEPQECESCGVAPNHPRNGMHRSGHVQEARPKRGLAVDHDHETGERRGFLCMSCNMALGMMQDDSELLRQLADYIESKRQIVAIA